MRGRAAFVIVVAWLAFGMARPTPAAEPLQTEQQFEKEIMVKALKALGSDVKFTIYPDAGHDSWTATYENPEFYRWLFEQRRKTP